MRILEDLKGVKVADESILTIGVFDGVHLGHQHLIDNLVLQAREDDRYSGIVTFREHPAVTLRSDFEPQYVTTLKDRLHLLRGLGANFVTPITFDAELSNLRVVNFLEILQNHLRMKGLVVGPDFAMGKGREGTIDRLEVLGGEMGFSLTVVENLTLDRDEAVRSTNVRNALKAGDVSTVRSQLGRTYSLTGRVIKGAGRGSQLGFPTANIEVPANLAIPADGIYACFAIVDGQPLMAAVSIGTRPTFKDQDHAIEVFILDYTGALYDRMLTIEFVQRIRGQEKYETIKALQDQVNRDVVRTREILASTAVG